jgi:hypothetical protein
MKKKGLITLFVVIGIVVVVAIVGVGYIATKGGIGGTFKGPEELKNLEESIEDCILNQAIKGIWLAGMQGGYITSPIPDSIETPFSTTPFGLKDGKNILLSKKIIEKEISNHVSQALPFCYQPIGTNYVLENEDPKVEVKIYDDYIKIISKMPIYAVSDSVNYKLNKEYNVDIPIRLGYIHDLSTQMIDRQIKEKEFVPISYLSQFDTEIIFDYHSDDIVYYMIHDEKSKVNNVTFNFLFACELVKDGK